MVPATTQACTQEHTAPLAHAHAPLRSALAGRGGGGSDGWARPCTTSCCRGPARSTRGGSHLTLVLACSPGQVLLQLRVVGPRQQSLLMAQLLGHHLTTATARPGEDRCWFIDLQGYQLSYTRLVLLSMTPCGVLWCFFPALGCSRVGSWLAISNPFRKHGAVCHSPCVRASSKRLGAWRGSWRCRPGATCQGGTA